MTVFRNLILLALLLSSFNCLSQRSDFNIQMEEFVREIDKLELPRFNIDYRKNLESIQSLDSVLRQEEVFMHLASKIRAVDRYSLSDHDRLSFELMRYEVNLNVERINLEKRWHEERPDSIPSNGVFELPIAQDWYRYLLHHWVDRTVEPDALFEFGKSQVAKVKARMEEVRHSTGLSVSEFEEYLNKDEFFCQTPQEIQSAYEAKKAEVADLLPGIFPFLDSIPPHFIKEFEEETSIQTPAFYRRGERTFYYNYFDSPYNLRQIAWIYLHEADPGHHYQIQLTDRLDRSVVQKRFAYSGYREGWAAYVEEIGKEIGAYKDIFDEYGKWEWDLIRSVRVVMDIGMNYYGWNDDEALAYWQEYISGQDDIARREIKRMRNWPAQVITYKYGAEKILRWKELFENRPDFNLLDFHRMVLEYGDVPFSVLEPFVLSRGLDIYNNILYVDEDRVKVDSVQRLNLLMPQDEVRPPLFLWIGGGAWAYVDRHREMNFARRIAQEGIAVASVGHRLSSAEFQDPRRTDGIKHPEHIKDIADAFRWLYDHADDYGYDKQRIYVGGFSSGAHLASLLSLDNKYLNGVGLDKSDIKGVIPIGGTYDILDYEDAFENSARPHLVEQHVHAVFGSTEQEHLDASPTSYVDDMSVPMLLMSDGNMIRYTNVFEERILESEFEDVVFVYVRNMSHHELSIDLENNDKSRYRDLIVDFIR